MTKVYQILCAILLIALLVVYFMYSYKSAQADKYKTKWQESEAKVENLQERIKANVAASKQKAELEKTMDNSKDSDNLNYVPDISILNQLRKSPV